MSLYKKRKLAAGYRSTEPSMTEQSMAQETDINVIISRFAISRTVPGSSRQPMSGDFSNLPTDLRGFIEAGKRLGQLRARLPEKLRNMSNEELFALTSEQLKTILTPPAPQPVPQEKK